MTILCEYKPVEAGKNVLAFNNKLYNTKEDHYMQESLVNT